MALLRVESVTPLLLLRHIATLRFPGVSERFIPSYFVLYRYEIIAHQS